MRCLFHAASFGAAAAATATAAARLFLFNYTDYGCGNYCHNHSQNYYSTHSLHPYALNILVLILAEQHVKYKYQSCDSEYSAYSEAA